MGAWVGVSAEREMEDETERVREGGRQGEREGGRKRETTWSPGFELL